MFTAVPGPTTAIARAVAVQSDAKIVVAGGLGAGQSIGLVRYNTNGTLDGSFGHNGIALANIPNNILSSAMGVAIQTDGKIVAGGTVYTLTGANAFIGLGVVRFNTNGSLNSGFGAAGVVATLPLHASRCGGGPVALQPDGKILLAGERSIGSGANAANFSVVIRLNTNGSLDSSFGNAGASVVAAAPSAMVLQSDGKILVASGGSVSRYNPNAMCELRDLRLGRQRWYFGCAGRTG